MNSIPEMFGSMVFNDEVMKKRLPSDVYKSLHKTIETGMVRLTWWRETGGQQADRLYLWRSNTEGTQAMEYLRKP